MPFLLGKIIYLLVVGTEAMNVLLKLEKFRLFLSTCSAMYFIFSFFFLLSTTI